MKKFFVSCIWIIAGLALALSIQKKEYTPQNAVIAWDFHDVIAYKPIGAMTWESIKIVRDADNRWELIKLLFSPTFIKELWYGLGQTKSGDRMIEEIVALHPTELSEHKEKIYSVATLHYISPEMIDIITRLKELGYVQVLASNIGHESLMRMEKKYPQVFSLFDGLFYDGAFKKNGERYTYKVKPSIEYFQALKEFLVERNWEQSHIIFIDDRRDNIDAAQNAAVGIDGIQFINASQLREELKKRGMLENKNIKNEQMQTTH
ncbi:MAG TPA: hypothetical protein VHO47_05850 [Candidatus Babeliales bacterium]|nr:hypothetical protein [Candidatus Babeliales bacterium]